MFPDTKATIHTLSNGLTIILDSDPAAPVISTQVWVNTGSIHEGQWMGAGISHLLEHMVFKGTESFTSESLSQTVQAAGGQWNAYTTFDRTVYYIDGPKESANTFLKAVTEMVFKPSFPIEEFEKEKDVIRREIDMGLDNPDGRASRQLFATALASDGRAQPVIGHLELFNQITHADMVAYHKARYTTDNTFLSIAGDFDKQAILAELESLVGSIPRSFTQQVQVDHEAPQLGKRTQRDTFAVPVSKLTLAWQTPGLSHPDAAALELLSTILGGGRSSRLYQNLREQRGLCQEISCWAWITHQPVGLFSVSAEVPHQQRDELTAAIKQEIQQLLASQLDTELAKAKRNCMVAQFKTLTTASGRASDLASNWHEARSLNFTKDFISAVDKVTEADIRRVCEHYLLSDTTLTETSLDPLDSVEAQAQSSTQSQDKEIVSHTLSNGLQLHLCADSRIPMVSIQAANLSGLSVETPESAGISTLLSCLLSKGTTSRTGAEIATQTEELGAKIGAGAGNNTGALAASCLSSDLDKVLEIFADCYANPVFHQEHIDFEKQSLLSSLQEQNEDPASLAFKTLRSNMFGSHGYGINQLGSEESLAKIDRLALTAHHALYYTAHNTQIAIFGDIDIPATIAIAEKHLSQIREGAKIDAPQQTLAEPSNNTLHLDKQQAVLTVGYPGASVHSDDIFALDLLHSWCSDMAGPLFTKIREELGLAYYCSATQFHGHNTGFFGFYLGTSPEQLELAQTELLKAIDQIASHGMDPETLDSVKNSWLASQSLANQSNAAMAKLCAVDTVIGFSPTRHRQAGEHIKAVTTEQIKAAAHKYFGQQQATIVVVTPEAAE
ncbi:M16 family metallopeptidase [Rubritalea marina]|uniref:M16 family metallopeptidase n=1 Tax=Rubritalea marina TaxID=361055 RepID=UPI0003607B6E|nr:pitrilysin family protein [Rubritalea marina]